MNKTDTSTRITVALGTRSYPIVAGPGLLSDLGSHLREYNFYSPLAVITDETVAAIYGERVMASLQADGYACRQVTFPAGEMHKHLQTVQSLYDQLVAMRLERKSGIIALGGGVVGDVAGFVAATYLRGVPFIQAPTTLLAQVDASVGGKVGVDHPGGKNLIGAFYQPQAVLIDTETLQTLPARELLAGLAEVIKHGVIADAALFERVKERLDWLKQADQQTYKEIIPWNCQIKAHVVEQDEREAGLRAILNFGHTIGHAIESLTGYAQYLHGEAVALGMLIEAQLGEALGITPAEVVRELQAVLQAAGFPLAKPDLSGEAMLESMFHDKKVDRGRLRFVFPTRMGEVSITPVEDTEAILRVWERDSPS